MECLSQDYHRLQNKHQHTGYMLNHHGHFTISNQELLSLSKYFRIKGQTLETIQEIVTTTSRHFQVQVVLLSIARKFH